MPVQIARVATRVLTIPTETPESDGTYYWADTTIVIAEVMAGGIVGIGYSYTHPAAATVIDRTLGPLLIGRDAYAITESWKAMAQALRNVGWSGIGASALSAIDVALWDLKAKLLGLTLAVLLGSMRDAVPIYGSGGFTNYPIDHLQAQLGGWAAGGMRMVKMKVGSHPIADPDRVKAAREAVGPDVALFVDANGAYDRGLAVSMAEHFAAQKVSWFEEPVSSDDVEGLRFVRDRAPAGMNVAAGEYGWNPFHFLGLLQAGAVDVLQADATRCGGISGFLKAAALCEAWNVRLSSHCAPALHVHLGCASDPFVHLEYFFDHVRIEEMLFEGAPRAADGILAPNFSRPGLGMALRREALSMAA